MVKRIDRALSLGATSMLLTIDELHSVQEAFRDSARLKCIVENWGLSLDGVRAAADFELSSAESLDA